MRLFSHTQCALAVKSKYGGNVRAGNDDDGNDDADAPSSSESTTEDEDAILDTPAKDVKFLQLLPLIANQDPDVAKLAEPVFKPEDGADEEFDDDDAAEAASRVAAARPHREKALRLNDYIRQQLLERGPEALLDDDDDPAVIAERRRRYDGSGAPSSYVGEQAALKESFLASFNEALAETETDNSNQASLHIFMSSFRPHDAFMCAFCTIIIKKIVFVFCFFLVAISNHSLLQVVLSEAC